MTDSPILGIPEVSQAQSSKEVTINEAIEALEKAGNKLLTQAVTGTTNILIADSGRNFIFKFTGTAGPQIVNFPAKGRFLFLINSTNGTLTIRVTGGAGVSITLAPTGQELVYTDGVDFFSMTPGLSADDISYDSPSLIGAATVQEALDILFGGGGGGGGGGGTTIWSAGGSRNSNLALSVSTDALVPMTSEDFDDNGLIDLGTHDTRITVPAGADRITLTGSAAFSATSGTHFIQIKKNGSFLPNLQANVALGANERGTVTTGVLSVTPGDYFEFNAFVNTVQNLTGMHFAAQAWHS